MKNIKFKYIIFLVTISMQMHAQLPAPQEAALYPRDTTFTVHSAFAKERKSRPYIKIAHEEVTNEIKLPQDFVYSNPTDGHALLLKVVRPNDDKKYPALLMVHGGGWSSGNLTMELPMAIRIAKRGYVTIPVEYRLSLEAPYPAAVHDLKTAIRWLRAHADCLGIDTTQIAISGCSAGGQLAGLIGATNNEPKYEGNGQYVQHTSTVQAVINVDGISDFTADDSVKAASQEFQNGKISASVRWLGGTYQTAKDNWIAASAIYHVTANSAPVCFINSSIPRFHNGRDEMILKLKAYGIYSEVHHTNDAPHPFWLFEPWFEPTVDRMTSFLDKTFKNK